MATIIYIIYGVTNTILLFGNTHVVYIIISTTRSALLISHCQLGKLKYLLVGTPAKDDEDNSAPTAAALPVCGYR